MQIQFIFIHRTRAAAAATLKRALQLPKDPDMRSDMDIGMEHVAL